MPSWLVVLLIALSSYRFSRLVAVDEFPPVVALRGRIGDRFGVDSSWAYLVTCPYCVSAYTSAIVVALSVALLDGGLPAPALIWAGTWGASALMTTASGDTK